MRVITKRVERARAWARRRGRRVHEAHGLVLMYHRVATPVADPWQLAVAPQKKELNFISYSNPEVDDLLEKGRRNFDIEERKKAYFRIQEILADEAPYLFLYVPDATPIVHARIQGIKPTAIGISYNMPKWYVPKPLQRHTLAP